jgi:quercetin dioxygenase-like cupin family protein
VTRDHAPEETTPAETETEREGADRHGSTPTPLVRRADAVEYEPVDAADGLARGVLVGPEDGAPNFAMRRFTLAAGAEVPRHTNSVEHEQYVLAGEYVVGIGEEEHRVTAGDSLLIPAGTVHWYRNDGDREGAFLCAVPNGDDAIELVE